tara:strand:+ start:185 stop:1093 length:909 start_codon:yes stop_codon:yes gene_type:complete
MANLSSKTARARASLKTSSHNNALVVAKHNGGHNTVQKAKHKHCHLSHNQQHFSLHGTHRTTPGIGRHYHHTPTHTLYKGNLPKGHGGHNGQYKLSLVEGGAPQRCASNEGTDQQLANQQTTSLNRHADLHSRFAKGYHGHYPNRWVQKTIKTLDNKEYVYNLQKQVVCLNQDNIQWKLSEFDCDGKCLKCETTQTATCCHNNDDNDPHLFGRRTRPARQRKLRANDSHLLFKILNADVKPASEYIKTRYMRKHNLPTPANRQHWPTEGQGATSCGGTTSFTKTWQEAQTLGQLPANYRPYT